MLVCCFFLLYFRKNKCLEFQLVGGHLKALLLIIGVLQAMAKNCCK